MGKWKKKIKQAQKLHRPSLKNWGCDELYNEFPLYVDKLSTSATSVCNVQQQQQQQNNNPKKWKKQQPTTIRSLDDCYYGHPCQYNNNNNATTNNQFMCFSLVPPPSFSQQQQQQQQQQQHRKGGRSNNNNGDGNRYRATSTSSNGYNRYYWGGDDDDVNNDENDNNNNEEKKDSSTPSNSWFSSFKLSNHNSMMDSTASTNECCSYHNIPIVLDAKQLPKEEFWERYEGKNLPCIIQNIPFGYDDGQPTDTGPWPAMRNWNLRQLLQTHNAKNDETKDHNKSKNDNKTDTNEKKQQQQQQQEKYYKRLLNRKYKCGEDDDGHSIKIRLKYFLQYVQNNYDDSPLYIFDSSFERDRYAKSLLDDYIVPSYFRYDLFTGLISEQRRPPYRWILIGPERSGSTVHIDPLATNAWNTLLEGKKRWVLFPPYVPKYIVKGKGLLKDKEDDEAIHYFMFLLPRIRQQAYYMRHHTDYKNFYCIEFTQNAGETVFVPHGWWHAVLNLTNTVGVTQNYVSERNFRPCWLSVRNGRKRMAWKWLQQLQTQYPHLYETALALNTRDNFIMKYDPAVQEQKRLQQQQQKKKESNNSDSGDDDDNDDDSSDDEKIETSKSNNHNAEHRKKMQRTV